MRSTLRLQGTATTQIFGRASGCGGALNTPRVHGCFLGPPLLGGKKGISRKRKSGKWTPAVAGGLA
jgi:hypothetical protein